MDTKTCERCGREFARPYTMSQANWAKRRFCGWECFKGAVLKPGSCPICGKDFRRRYGGQKTCGSAECRAEYRRTISGPATAERMRADYAAGKRKVAPGISPRERLLWPLLAPEGWYWRLRWMEAGGEFELDFAHVARMLNVEIDGIEHREPRNLTRDAARDDELAGRGWRILRIPNEEVDASPEAVAEKIRKWAASVR